MSRPSVPSLDLHLTLSWRDDVIAFRRLSGEGTASLGAGPFALAPIPCGPELAGGFDVARVSAGKALVHAPEGATITLWRADERVDLVEGPALVALGEGDRAELVHGDFRLTTVAGAPEALPRGRRRRMAGAWGALAAAALAHAVVLGLAARDAMASSVEEREDARTAELAGLLASAELRARGDDRPIEDGVGAGQGMEANDKRGDGRTGGGARALGNEGKMGDRGARAGEARRYAVPERVARDRDPSTARAEAMVDASTFGMIGLLAQGPQVPVAPFADAEAHGADGLAANGAMWARLPGEAFGESGLGLTGIGEGGGGSGEGVGLGRVGTLGHTDGDAGRGLGGEGSPRSLGGGSWGVGVGESIGIGDIGHIGHLIGHHSHGAYTCTLRCGYDAAVSGRLPPETVRRVVRQNFGRFRACYEKSLLRNPTLEGRVSTRFVIDRSGAVVSAEDGGSDLPDAGVVACVVGAFRGISFPQPEGGIVTVSYPIVFSPG
jgi:hypothetical protein